ncbi:hypothetical protein ERJ75_001020200 [Trypanosoma vivax]|nr:hypothetical protein TRVL_03239 [Trypanosoma vivax]KAH8611282.1 hypothetical protein ERJ75_001020200 [Trypanosoma vivax]
MVYDILLTSTVLLLGLVPALSSANEEKKYKERYRPLGEEDANKICNLASQLRGVPYSAENAVESVKEKDGVTRQRVKDDGDKASEWAMRALDDRDFSAFLEDLKNASSGALLEDVEGISGCGEEPAPNMSSESLRVSIEETHRSRGTSWADTYWKKLRTSTRVSDFCDRAMQHLRRAEESSRPDPAPGENSGEQDQGHDGNGEGPQDAPDEPQNKPLLDSDTAQIGTVSVFPIFFSSIFFH